MPANGRFVEDMTIPDDSAILAETAFTKTWLVENNGDVPWEAGYQLVFATGINMAAVNEVSLPPCAPGERAPISIAMTAPATPGTAFSNWRFRDNQGNLFGEIIFVRILVKVITAPTILNNSSFVADITIPDDSKLDPGKSFTKIWRVRNTGILPWNDRYVLSFVVGTLGRRKLPVSLPPLAPGGEVNLAVKFTAPKKPGTYYSDWQMKDDTGRFFGDKLWTRIIVPASNGATASTDSETPAITVEVSAPHYSQRDSRWSNIRLANLAIAPSIGRWGCLLTSFAMLATAMGHAVTPAALNDLLAPGGGFVNGFHTRWNALQVIFDDIHYETKLDQPQVMIDRIGAHLEAGYPVPVLVDLTPATAYSDNDQHWVLAVGRNGDDYWMNDPIDFAAPTSLMKRYGSSSGKLIDAVRSAILYRKKTPG